MVFLVIMYRFKSWTIKKAECWRTDAFELWCWRRLLRVPWTARRSNQSILKEISPEYHWKDGCWSWNSNTLAAWCEELTHLKRERVGGQSLSCGLCLDSLEKTLMLGKIAVQTGEGDNRGWDGWVTSPTQRTWVRASSGRWWRTEKPGMLQSLGSQRVRHDWATQQQQRGNATQNTLKRL